MFPLDDLAEAFYRILQLHILTLHAGELLSDMEGLGKETLDLSRAPDD